MGRNISLVPVGGHGELQPRVNEPHESFVARTENQSVGSKRGQEPMEEPLSRPPSTNPEHVRKKRVDFDLGPKPVFAMNDSHVMLLAVLLCMAILVTVMATGGSFF